MSNGRTQKEELIQMIQTSPLVLQITIFQNVYIDVYKIQTYI